MFELRMKSLGMTAPFWPKKENSLQLVEWLESRKQVACNRVVGKTLGEQVLAVQSTKQLACNKLVGRASFGCSIYNASSF